MSSPSCLTFVNGSLAPGQEVYLYTPENPRLHGARGTVCAVTEYGAVVQCGAAATGVFRALNQEMTYEPPLSIPDEYPLDAYVGKDDTVLETMPPSPAFKAKEYGYTGDVCQSCGDFKMRRNGSCLLCEGCGRTSGCS